MGRYVAVDALVSDAVELQPGECIMQQIWTSLHRDGPNHLGFCGLQGAGWEGVTRFAVVTPVRELSSICTAFPCCSTAAHCLSLCFHGLVLPFPVGSLPLSSQLLRR